MNLKRFKAVSLVLAFFLVVGICQVSTSGSVHAQEHDEPYFATLQSRTIVYDTVWDYICFDRCSSSYMWPSGTPIIVVSDDWVGYTIKKIDSDVLKWTLRKTW